MAGCCKETRRASVLMIVGMLVLGSLVMTKTVARRRASEIGPEHVHVISGGFTSTNRVYIAVNDHIFYDDVPDCAATAGLYVVALYDNQVVLQYFYHTYQIEGASEGLARDIESLPDGALVIVAAKDEPTRYFDQRGQDALLSIGAAVGLQGQAFRTSYLCVGHKGAAPGEAIERAGMEELVHRGNAGCARYGCPELVFPAPETPEIFAEPGIYEGLKIGATEVMYYIPSGFDPNTAEYFFGIHGAGDWHRPGAVHRIEQFKDIADRENLVLVAPAFDVELNWEPNWPDDFDQYGRFKDPRIVKGRYLWDFVGLLNGWGDARADRKLIEIFDVFNQHLMTRERFHLYGHSGGAQFALRFALFYPELLDKVAASSPGTFTFPLFDVDYPYGLNMRNLPKTYPAITDYDGIDLDFNQLRQKLAAMLDLHLILTVGQLETWEDHPDLAWQGFSTLDKAINYYDVMALEAQALKDQGFRDSESPFLFEFHVLPGVAHDSGASGAAVGRLMFPR
jgi:pimeloyl-ACP methyl ester carboxylesterase